MTEPSKVLHIRNVGPEVSEQDLLQIIQPFGLVTKMVMLRAKNQALLQMQDVVSASNTMQYYANVQPNVRGRNVYIQFSSHQELTSADQPGQPRRTGSEQPNRILLVSIYNPVYPITVDVLQQLFSPHGYVEKIVTFQKSAGLQALIQYLDEASALLGQKALQGRNIYDGCCTLDIQFSNLSDLQVHYNNDRTRDFTNPSLPADQLHQNANHNHNNILGQPFYGEAGNIYGMQSNGSQSVMFQQGSIPQAMGLNSYQMPLGTTSATAAAFGGVLPLGITGTNERSTILVSNFEPEKLNADNLFNLFSNYGNIMRIKLLHNKPDHALVQMGDGLQAELAVSYLKGVTLFGKRLEVNFSKYYQINPSADTHDYSNSTLNRFNRNVPKSFRYCCSPTKMIHISSLPNGISESAITAHLASHGNILNVKTLEANGKKQALVLFENEEQATEALVCKHATQLNGSNIRLAFSKLTTI